VGDGGNKVETVSTEKGCGKIFHPGVWDFLIENAFDIFHVLSLPQLSSGGALFQVFIIKPSRLMKVNARMVEDPCGPCFSVPDGISCLVFSKSSKLSFM
jgi:hypothetical protein